MVTMRILQDLDAWDAIDPAEQERIVGRRKGDGSRLDLAEGAPIDQEGEITSGTALPLDSHIAKAGPRGEAPDRVRIFRRGLPFTELTADGHCEAGLLFVSFQASMDQFHTISDEWMGNADFPDPNTKTDALFRDGHATVTAIGSFFVPANRAPIPAKRSSIPSPRTTAAWDWSSCERRCRTPKATRFEASCGESRVGSDVPRRSSRTRASRAYRGSQRVGLELTPSRSFTLRLRLRRMADARGSSSSTRSGG